MHRFGLCWIRRERRRPAPVRRRHQRDNAGLSDRSERQGRAARHTGREAWRGVASRRAACSACTCAVSSAAMGSACASSPPRSRALPTAPRTSDFHVSSIEDCCLISARISTSASGIARLRRRDFHRRVSVAPAGRSRTRSLDRGLRHRHCGAGPNRRPRVASLSACRRLRRASTRPRVQPRRIPRNPERRRAAQSNLRGPRLWHWSTDLHRWWRCQDGEHRCAGFGRQGLTRHRVGHVVGHHQRHHRCGDDDRYSGVTAL